MLLNSYNFYEKQLRDGKKFSGRKWKYSYGCTVKPHNVSKKKKKKKKLGKLCALCGMSTLVTVLIKMIFRWLSGFEHLKSGLVLQRHFSLYETFHPASCPSFPSRPNKIRGRGSSAR